MVAQPPEPKSASNHFARHIQASWHSACHGGGAYGVVSMWICMRFVGVSHYLVCLTASKTVSKPPNPGKD